MEPAKKTDWEAYYRLRSNPVTKYSKAVVKHSFLVPLRKYWPSKGAVSIAELGGSHSFLQNAIEKEFSHAEYHIVDSHFFSDSRTAENKIRFHHKNILDLKAGDLAVDVVISTGLIEHFGDGTAKAIEAHFKILKPGGLALVSFPTPTFSYKMIRGAMEKAGAWIFHDETPLRVDDVRREMERHGRVLESHYLSALPLTQALLVVRARG